MWWISPRGAVVGVVVAVQARRQRAVQLLAETPSPPWPSAAALGWYRRSRIRHHMHARVQRLSCSLRLPTDSRRPMRRHAARLWRCCRRLPLGLEPCGCLTVFWKPPPPCIRLLASPCVPGAGARALRRRLRRLSAADGGFDFRGALAALLSRCKRACGGAALAARRDARAPSLPLGFARGGGWAAAGARCLFARPMVHRGACNLEDTSRNRCPRLDDNYPL